MERLFLHRTNERRYDPSYRGDILLWDIDKTYLDTRFSSWRGLLGIPFEFAIDKTAIPGAVPLLRALRRGPGDRSALVPLYFVSGSPIQLREVIERKMMLDGVEFDGITFKDQLGLAKAGRFRDLKAQTAYKLSALLLYRREVPEDARWLLFGDDVEDDEAIFTLFGRVLGGFVGPPLVEELVRRGVREDEARWIDGIATPLATLTSPVDRIFIQCQPERTPAAREDGRVIEARSFLQTALVCADIGRIRRDAISAVAGDLRARGVAEGRIEAELWDARSRLRVPEELIRFASR